MGSFPKTFTVVAYASLALAQYNLHDDEVPYQGGNILKANDPELKNFTFTYKVPFEPEQYGGYYSWAVNNNTVAGSNFTGPHMQPGYDYFPEGSLTTHPYFIINEGNPRVINETKLFSNCNASHVHPHNFYEDSGMGKGSESKVKRSFMLSSRTRSIAGPWPLLTGRCLPRRASL
jgi:hypothetical protein